MVSLPKVLMMIGVMFLLLGGILWLAPKVPGLDRLGKLPGDIRIERKGFSIYVPWVSCLLISLVLTALFQLIQGWRK